MENANMKKVDLKWALIAKFFTLAPVLLITACATGSMPANVTNEVEVTQLPQAIIEAQNEKPFAEHKLVLQLSNQKREADVLDVANNLIKNYGGPEYIDIEIVTFNEGVRLLYADSPHAERIASLVENGVRFSVCANTIDSMERRTGVRPELSEHADMVQAGVARMMTLIEHGYIHIKP